MTAPALTMAQTAAACGLAYETFRKSWPKMVRKHGLPSPLPGSRLRVWNAAAVDDWLASRSKLQCGTAYTPPPPANDGRTSTVHPLDRPGHNRLVAQQRNAIAARMAGAHRKGA